MLSTKFHELKSQGIFIRSTLDFAKTNWVTDSSLDAGITSDKRAFVTVLENPDSRSRYYIIRQAISSSTEKISFQMRIETSQRAIRIPQTANTLELDGRQGKTIVTDYAFGAHSKALYSTASVFFAGRIGERDVLFLHGSSSQHHEAAIWLGKSGSASKHPLVVFSEPFPSGLSLVQFMPGINALVTVWDSSEQLVLYADTETTASFWSPVLAGQNELANHWQLGTNASVLVGGPYLVRNATLHDNLLALRGDLIRDTMLTVIGPSEIKAITWNGQMVDNLRVDGSGSYLASLSLGSEFSSIPVAIALESWKYAEGIPEIDAEYSDVDWVEATNKKTNIPSKPQYGDGSVLYGCDYGL
jgi:hypothetical protein